MKAWDLLARAVAAALAIGTAVVVMYVATIVVGGSRFAEECLTTLGGSAPAYSRELTWAGVELGCDQTSSGGEETRYSELLLWPYYVGIVGIAPVATSVFTYVMVRWMLLGAIRIGRQMMEGTPADVGAPSIRQARVPRRPRRTPILIGMGVASLVLTLDHLITMSALLFPIPYGREFAYSWFASALAVVGGFAAFWVARGKAPARG